LLEGAAVLAQPAKKGCGIFSLEVFRTWLGKSAVFVMVIVLL